MSSPRVSVIVPVYNGARYLGEAIQSVLDQSFADFELLLVDDASPDNSAEIASRYHDPRLKYLRHPKNLGSDRARHTGLQESTGEIIAFLDQDDQFHPDKLRLHVAYLDSHPEVGFTYNARYELNYSSTTVRGLWRPPREISLADLVLWFPLSPSDVVLRREWALRMDLVGGSLSWCGGEIVHFGGLFLSGCKFGCVDRALNRRRYHSGRVIRDLAGGCESELYAQRKILEDPRCPPEVVSLRDVAHANLYLFWGFRALAQGETGLGQGFIREAVRLKPGIVNGKPSELLNHLLINAIDDESVDHAAFLGKLLAQLPPELASISGQLDWAVARGYLLRGVRAVIWDRPDDGRRHFEQAMALEASVDGFLVDQVARSLLDYAQEFGEEATQRVLLALVPHLERLGGRAVTRRLRARYHANRAFDAFRGGEGGVARMVAAAVWNDPGYARNRGLWSVLLRSALRGSSDASRRQDSTRGA